MLYVIYPDVDIYNYLFDGFDGKGKVEVVPLNRNCSLLQLVFRKVFPKLKSNIRLLFGKEICKKLKSLTKDDSLLICDYMDLCLIKTIAGAVDPDVKKSLWLWNPMKGANEAMIKKCQRVIEACGFDLYTFDQVDAETYGMTWLTSFSRKPNCDGKYKNENDFYFVGFEKGRKQVLDSISEDLRNYSLNFCVINDIRDAVAYGDNIKNIMKSRCVVEILQEKQSGATTRTLDTLLMQKKLFTNNKNIKNMDFYSPNNVFIYGEDDISKIGEFLESSFEQIPRDILYKYTLEGWLDNFR